MYLEHEALVRLMDMLFPLCMLGWFPIILIILHTITETKYNGRFLWRTLSIITTLAYVSLLVYRGFVYTMYGL